MCYFSDILWIIYAAYLISCKLCVSGTSHRRSWTERWGSRITSLQPHLLSVIPVPLFLYNSGEYFYQLFSKYRFFSSLIVENTFFLWNKKVNLETGFSSYPKFCIIITVAIIVIVSGFHFSFSNVKEGRVGNRLYVNTQACCYTSWANNWDRLPVDYIPYAL